ncbi:hypothetical protein V8C86DRAFT_2478640 [Haematococcus lacustris]
MWVALVLALGAWAARLAPALAPGAAAGGEAGPWPLPSSHTLRCTLLLASSGDLATGLAPPALLLGPGGVPGGWGRPLARVTGALLARAPGLLLPRPSPPALPSLPLASIPGGAPGATLPAAPALGSWLPLGPLLPVLLLAPCSTAPATTDPGAGAAACSLGAPGSPCCCCCCCSPPLLLLRRDPGRLLDPDAPDLGCPGRVRGGWAAAAGGSDARPGAGGAAPGCEVRRVREVRGVRCEAAAPSPPSASPA